MAPSTNLALRPFRNERLPWLMAALLLAAALVISFVHGRFISRLLSGDEANTVRVVRENEERIAELEDRISSEPPLKIESTEAVQLRALKDLVDRRVFPWRRLLTELEETLGGDVRLIRISSSAARGARGMLIGLSGVARTKDAAFSLAEALDASEAFSNASLKSLSEEEQGIEFALEVVFDPIDAASATKGPAERAPQAPGPRRSGPGERP
jgi:Tfp pilus assembly protein PilN